MAHLACSLTSIVLLRSLHPSAGRYTKIDDYTPSHPFLLSYAKRVVICLHTTPPKLSFSRTRKTSRTALGHSDPPLKKRFFNGGYALQRAGDVIILFFAQHRMTILHIFPHILPHRVKQSCLTLVYSKRPKSRRRVPVTDEFVCL